MILSSTRSPISRDFAFGVLALIAVATASIVGQLATYPNLVPWDAWVAQTILRLPETSAKRRWALGLLFAQLVLNAAWSWMFFAPNNPLLGLTDIVPQLLVILATIVAFHQLDRMAGALFRWRCGLPLRSF